jgi:hypothetical protein
MADARSGTASCASLAAAPRVLHVGVTLVRPRPGRLGVAGNVTITPPTGTTERAEVAAGTGDSERVSAADTCLPPPSETSTVSMRR